MYGQGVKLKKNYIKPFIYSWSVIYEQSSTKLFKVNQFIDDY